MQEPKFREEKFICPNCKVLSQQTWFSKNQLNDQIKGIYNHIYLDYRSEVADYNQEAIRNFLNSAHSQFPKLLNLFIDENLYISNCKSCDKYSVWIDGQMVFPRQLNIEPPNEDLDEEIQEIYLEASKIISDSPRGAAALLRLGLQLLLRQLGKSGKNINNDIKELVTSGLTTKIQKALDLLRVVGNNAVHPGLIDLDDNKDIANKMFKVLNLIANEMITKPKELEMLYEEVIPEETKGHINQRDNREE